MHFPPEQHAIVAGISDEEMRKDLSDTHTEIKGYTLVIEGLRTVLSVTPNTPDSNTRQLQMMITQFEGWRTGARGLAQKLRFLLEDRAELEQQEKTP